jgi:hypothetical protein
MLANLLIWNFEEARARSAGAVLVILAVVTEWFQMAAVRRIDSPGGGAAAWRFVCVGRRRGGSSQRHIDVHTAMTPLMLLLPPLMMVPTTQATAMMMMSHGRRATWASPLHYSLEYEGMPRPMVVELELAANDEDIH